MPEVTPIGNRGNEESVVATGALMDAWARYCASTPVAAKSGDVVAMKR